MQGIPVITPGAVVTPSSAQRPASCSNWPPERRKPRRSPLRAVRLQVGSDALVGDHVIVAWASALSVEADLGLARGSLDG